MQMTICTAAFIVSCLSIAQAAPPDFTQVDAKIDAWVAAKQYPGAALVIVDSTGNTLHEKYWNGYTRDTVVMMASASKWIEAATTMSLVDAGLLDLDRPIADYLPELKNSPQGTNTLRQMFSHTSSLNSIQIDDRQGVDRFPAMLAAGKTDVRPGAQFAYGGTALATASRIVEVVTGKPWLTVFAENIAKPCEMTRTVTGQNLWTFDRTVGGDNFPSTNAADYLHFMQMILNDGVYHGKRVLSTKAVAEMQDDQIKTATFKRPQYPEQTLEQTHHGVYGLGEWRMVVDPKDQAQVLCSTSFAGLLPWIDKRHAIAGIFVGRCTGDLDAFHASPELIRLVDESMGMSVSPNR